MDNPSDETRRKTTSQEGLRNAEARRVTAYQQLEIFNLKYCRHTSQKDLEL